MDLISVVDRPVLDKAFPRVFDFGSNGVMEVGIPIVNPDGLNELKCSSSSPSVDDVNGASVSVELSVDQERCVVKVLTLPASRTALPASVALSYRGVLQDKATISFVIQVFVEREDPP